MCSSVADMGLRAGREMSEGVARAQVLSPFLSRTSWLLSPPPLVILFCTSRYRALWGGGVGGVPEES